jgi:hypothetical protein
MSPEAIDAELAKNIEGKFPKTVADALTFILGRDLLFRATIDTAPTDAGSTAHLTFEVKLDLPMEVARVHLRRLQRIEDRGEPQDHELFRKDNL